jgi:hypothetical protein
MKPCRRTAPLSDRHRRRLAATSGRSCSAALRHFFVPQAHAAQHGVQRRKTDPDPAAFLQTGLQLGQGLIRLARDQPLEHGPMRLQKWPTIAAETLGRRAARRLHPLHQLDRRRRADREAPRRSPDRAASRHRLHDTRPQIHRQRCRH